MLCSVEKFIPIINIFEFNPGSSADRKFQIFF